MLRDSVEQWLQSIWYGASAPPWWLEMLAAMHAWMRRMGWFAAPTKSLVGMPVPVVVVGNLVAGGAGKTPIVAALAKALMHQGWRVGVICRAYGSQKRVIPTQSITADSDVGVVGDEPVMLSTQLGSHVWVGSNRAHCLAQAMLDSVDVIISDDGLQSRRLWRSYEVAVVSASRQFGNGRLLPAGPLREPMDRLGSVDQVLLSRYGFETRALPLEGLGSLTSEAIFDVTKITHPQSGASLPKDQFKNQHVLAICGIADPLRFSSVLRSLGMNPTVCAYSDHHAFSGHDFSDLERDTPIFVTEKDWVKVKRLELSQAHLNNLFVLEVAAQLSADFINSISEHIRKFHAHA